MNPWLISPYLFDVSFEISFHFQYGVAAELFMSQAGNGQRNHGFSSHSGGGNDANSLRS